MLAELVSRILLNAVENAIEKALVVCELNDNVHKRPTVYELIPTRADAADFAKLFLDELREQLGETAWDKYTTDAAISPFTNLFEDETDASDREVITA